MERIMGGELSPPTHFRMNNELFVSLYDSLFRKLSFDMQDATGMRSIRIIRHALNHMQAPIILSETVLNGSALYEGFYPLDEKSYRAALPHHGIIRFNQFNLFNDQAENRRKRIFTGGLDRRDGVCFLYSSLTLPASPDDSDDAVKRLFYFVDIFASCLGLKLLPVNLEWYSPEKKSNGGYAGEKQ